MQGVGFRDATVRRARELDVLGWVRNGEEGTVEVHAEGSAPAVEQLVAFLGNGPALARVAGGGKRDTGAHAVEAVLASLAVKRELS